MEQINFLAEIIKVQVMQVAPSIRVTLDLPESETMIMAHLAECKRQGALLKITAEPVFPDEHKGRFG